MYDLKYFKPNEFSHAETIDPMLAKQLDEMRSIYNAPIYITGSYRDSTDGPRTSAHTIGSHGFWQAVDIRCSDSEGRFLLVSAAYLAGFRRIGVYDRHIHIDVAEEGFDQDVMWMGVSK